MFRLIKSVALSKKCRKYNISFFQLNKVAYKKKSSRNGKFRLLGKAIKYTHRFWFFHSLVEIFIGKTYWFTSKTEEPVIIDCGANIGLSIIYFKYLYPKSKLIGLEPDKIIFQILKENISQFKYDFIELHNKAVWIKNELLSFNSDGALGGKISEGNNLSKDKIEGIRLKEFLTKKVDFLKIDIEGAEYEVLKDCQEELVNVENLFIEYHSDPKEEQRLDEILLILKKSGFRYYIKEAWNNMTYPFIEKKGHFYDLQLNIFAYRI